MKNQTTIDTFNRAEWEHHLLTPKHTHVFAQSVKEFSGKVENAERVLFDTNEPAVLVYPKGGEKPSILLDLGAASPGGYPVFRVKSSTGDAVLRISYSDQYDYIVHPEYGDTGDFKRGCCKYLGVELPVPPANPYRYELYSVNEPGLYSFPLIQGQQRWVKLQLEHEDSEVELECFYIINVSDMSDHEGFFLCSDDAITKLWYASTYTAQISSFQNANAWEIVSGWLAPRGLAKSNDVGLSCDGESWVDYRFAFDFRIMYNPGPVSSIGWVVRAEDENNCYVFQIDLDGRFFVQHRRNGVYRNIKKPQLLSKKIIDAAAYHIETMVSGNEMRTYFDGELIDVTVDDQFVSGRIGFCQPLDKWALVQNVMIRDAEDKLLLSDDFSGDLSQWDFTRTLSFLADGAKRDRLPWIGDLDWAGRNVFYAFRNHKYMADSYRMFAHHQTPEGYIWAVCYPENNEKPKIGEYGYYQSDIFSAWFIPSVADHILFTGDKEFAAEMYSAVKLDAEYLWKYVELDGLFCQRYDTSKGLWSHDLEQVGRFAYHNILIHDAFEEAAFIADFLGEQEDALEYRNNAAIMKKAIMEHFWCDNQGCFVGETGSTEPDYMANALALAIKFLDKDKAVRTAEYLKNSHYEHGKIISLMIRGCYTYGLDTLGLERLRNPGGRINWLNAIDDWKGPCTTWECMIFPIDEANGENWFDLSHADTAMGHIMSGYMLGVQPTTPGFSQYRIEPHSFGLKWAKGSVPTPHGDILCGWSAPENSAVFELYLESPENTTATAAVPFTGSAASILVNGQEAYSSEQGFQLGFSGYVEEQYINIIDLGAGTYRIIVK
jgi:alpha-L-rhamnosidase